jgi:hypothetical protein
LISSQNPNNPTYTIFSVANKDVVKIIFKRKKNRLIN